MAWIGAILLAWLCGITTLSYVGVFQAREGWLFQAVGPGIAIPFIIGVLVYRTNKSLSTLVNSIPVQWLIGLQVYRVVGFLFLALYWRGALPGEFAIDAGIGDILVGVTAPVAAWMVAAKKPYGIAAAYIWNIFGIADMLWAVSSGLEPRLAYCSHWRWTRLT